VAALGLQAEYEQLLQHARETIPGLRQLNVELHPPYDTGIEDRVIIEAVCAPLAHGPDDRTWWEYSRWKVTTFPPDVYRHFTVTISDDLSHGG
jgi:hypothetical protein